MEKHVNKICVILSCLIVTCNIDVGYALKPMRSYPFLPSKFGIIYREVNVQTSDNLILKGWIFPPQDTSGISNTFIKQLMSGKVKKRPEKQGNSIRKYAYNNLKNPTIIICDGDAMNMAPATLYAYHYFTHGYTVFLFDWRGFGRSGEWELPQNLLCSPKFLEDFSSAIAFIKKQPEVDAQKIGLFGFSTGAYISFAMLQEHSNIKAFVGRGLITTLKDLEKNLGKVDPKRRFYAPKDYPQELMPINLAGKITTPAFLIVGKKDKRTPVWMTQKVYKEIKSKKRLWIIPDAGHGGRNGPEYLNYPDFFKKTKGFFDEYLK